MYDPAKHAEQDTEPSPCEKVPGEHGMQVETFLAPRALEYVPEGHNKQVEGLSTL